MKYRILILILLMTTACSTSTNSLVSWGNEFVEIEPFFDKEQLACAHNSELSWRSSIQGDELRIEPREFETLKLPARLTVLMEKLGARKFRIGSKLLTTGERHSELGNPNAASAFLELESGWIVGFNLGEFGGGLWWVDNEGNGQKLSYENIHDIFWNGDNIIVTTGLAHLSLDGGSLLEFKDRGDQEPLLLREIKSPSSIEEISTFESGWVAATFLGPVFININGEVRYNGAAVFRGPNVIYPNSISVDDQGAVYISGRYATAIYRNAPDDFSPSWLVSKKCTRFTPDERKIDCTCIAE
ncbi:MAG: hypothetical protein AAFR03_14005 [Pseudomonadota bacterium]